jgi:acyl phosphate:glycerol-3-phosphate acyltransferase
MTFQFLALLLGGYLLGSIPVGVLVARSKGIDIQQVGSGNIGATNVSRALGKRAGLFVFALDVSKGFVPALIARVLLKEAMWGLDAQVLWFMVGAAAVLGHSFTPWLRFRGGKGIATGLGMLLASSTIVALAAFGVFLLCMALWRYVSLGSILAVASLALFGWLMPGQSPQMVPLYILLFLFVLYKHRDNIGRLRQGTEPKFR